MSKLLRGEKRFWLAYKGQAETCKLNLFEYMLKLNGLGFLTQPLQQSFSNAMRTFWDDDLREG